MQFPSYGDTDASLQCGLALPASDQEIEFGSFRRGAAETNPTRNHEVVGSILGLAQWVKDLVLPQAAL